MSGPEHDPEFEAFLKRRSPMYRRLSDIDHAEPSVEMDRLVLGRARDAIEAPAQSPVYRKARWAMPLGLAASILIAFTVVLNIDPASQQRAQVAAAPQAVAPAESSAALADTAAPRAQPERRELARRTESQDLVASTNSARIIAGPDALAKSEADRPAPAALPAPATGDVHASAEAWLREINRLRAEGKTAEADRELVAFREAYPTHPSYSYSKPPIR